MKRIFIAMALFSACAALVSCKSGCTGERDSQPEVWHAGRIAWKLAESNAVEYIDIELEPREVVNDTAEEKWQTIEWLEGLSGSSVFECNDSDMFALAAASVPSVIVPSEEMILSKDEWRYMASGVEAPLCAGESDLPFTTKISDRYTLTPMTKFEFGGTVTLKRLNVMFRIEMSEENTGEVRYVEGLWHGTFYHSMATETYVSDLK